MNQGFTVLFMLKSKSNAESLFFPSVEAYMSGICDRYYLFPLLIELPVLAFFVFFFFGQHLTGGHLVRFIP